MTARIVVVFPIPPEARMHTLEWPLVSCSAILLTTLSRPRKMFGGRGIFTDPMNEVPSPLLHLDLNLAHFLRHHLRESIDILELRLKFRKTLSSLEAT